MPDEIIQLLDVYLDLCLKMSSVRDAAKDLRKSPEPGAHRDLAAMLENNLNNALLKLLIR